MVVLCTKTRGKKIVGGIKARREDARDPTKVVDDAKIIIIQEGVGGNGLNPHSSAPELAQRRWTEITKQKWRTLRSIAVHTHTHTPSGMYQRKTGHDIE